jgi:hypothetical protein
MKDNTSPFSKNANEQPGGRYGYQRPISEIYLTASPPNTFIGGPVPNEPGFRLKACRNDGLPKEKSFNQKLSRRERLNYGSTLGSDK